MDGRPRSLTKLLRGMASEGAMRMVRGAWLAASAVIVAGTVIAGGCALCAAALWKGNARALAANRQTATGARRRGNQFCCRGAASRIGSALPLFCAMPRSAALL